MNGDLKCAVLDYIRKNFLFDDKRVRGDDESLLGSGVVDSTGILELISFLEETYHVKFSDKELVGDNFDSVNRIVNFMTPKILKAKENAFA